MKKISIIALLWCITVNMMAQNFPVGIVSVQDTVKGFQLGIISSVNPDGGKGVQLSGFSNTSAHTFNGLQLSGISNITGGMNRGVQLSAIMNVSSSMMRGLQLGAVNYSDSLNGAQIGVFNIARKRPKGWQVGLINEHIQHPRCGYPFHGTRQQVLGSRFLPFGTVFPVVPEMEPER